MTQCNDSKASSLSHFRKALNSASTCPLLSDFFEKLTTASKDTWVGISKHASSDPKEPPKAGPCISYLFIMGLSYFIPDVPANIDSLLTKPRCLKASTAPK